MLRRRQKKGGIFLLNDCLHATSMDLIFGVIVYSFQEHLPDCPKSSVSVPSQQQCRRSIGQRVLDAIKFPGV